MADFYGTEDDDLWVGADKRSDYARGRGGNDTLFGAGGNDRLFGDEGADSLMGETGNDYIQGNDGADYIDGGGDDDKLFSADEVSTWSDDPGADIDTLIGGDGDDSIYAGYGDQIDGGEGIDTLHYSFEGADAGVTADFRDETLIFGGGTITGIEQIEYVHGSQFDDYIQMGEQRGGYLGGLRGLGGDDYLISGLYTKTVYGDEGNDTIDARNSPYLRYAGGHAGDDVIYAACDTATVQGGDGDDVIEATGEASGGPGNDTISEGGGGAIQFVYGDEGDDHITLAAESRRDVFGGEGADTIIGDEQDNLLCSGEAFHEAPLADLGLEKDQLFGGGGNDSLRGGFGDDLDGGDGSDIAYLRLDNGTEGVRFDAKALFDGHEINVGGGILVNIERIAKVTGTEFADRYILGEQSRPFVIEAGGGNDVVICADSEASVEGGDGNDRLISGAAADSFDGGDGIDTVDYVQSSTGVSVVLGLEDGEVGHTTDGDTLISVERVFGSNHDDQISGRNNNDRFKGREGDDTIFGNDGRDRIFGNDGDDSLVGGAGNDILAGQNGADRVEGGDGDDRVSGNDGDDFLYGNEGDDILFGGAGNDLLNGGAGDDKLLGDEGDDILRGSAGADRFIFRGDFGIDEIADFASGVDRIGLADLRGVNGGDELTIDQLLITQRDDDTWIELDLNRDGVADMIDLDGDSVGDAVRIELLHFDATTLTAADFQF